MFQIYGYQGEPEPEHKVGSPHTTILDLSTIVLHIDCFQKYFVRFVKYLVHWINEQKVLIMFLLII